MGFLRKTDYGRVVTGDPGSDRVVESGTLQCCHCGGHWVPQPGSGRVRGWCVNCSGPVCGGGCAECVPAELLLENIEKGRPLNFKPTVVHVPGGIHPTEG